MLPGKIDERGVLTFNITLKDVVALLTIVKLFLEIILRVREWKD